MRERTELLPTERSNSLQELSSWKPFNKLLKAYFVITSIAIGDRCLVEILLER